MTEVMKCFIPNLLSVYIQGESISLLLRIEGQNILGG